MILALPNGRASDTEFPIMKRIAKKIILVAVGLTSAVGLFSPTSAETPKLVQFHMALLKKGPKWETTPAAERNKILQQHLANVLSMLDSGKAVIAGPLGEIRTS